jgi:hypothetical protein
MNMLRTAPAAAVLILLAATSGVAEQARKPVKPDFSGTWTLDPARDGRAPQPREMIVKHTPRELVVERQTASGASSVMKYRLDGSRSVNLVQLSAGITTELESVAKWDGGKVVISTSRGAGEPVVETWSMEGGVLIVQTGPAARRYRKVAGR